MTIVCLYGIYPPEIPRRKCKKAQTDSGSGYWIHINLIQEDVSVKTGLLLSQDMLSLVQAAILLVLCHVVYPNSQPPNQPEVCSLPPCGSNRDCTTGHNHVYDFRINVPSLASCHLFCHSDPQCNYYSYNYKQSSALYRHCFMMVTPDCLSAVGEDDSDGWVSAPKRCNNNPTSLLAVLMASNDGYLRSTK